MENIPITTKTEARISLFLSFFFVIFLWGFWFDGVHALGINFAVYLIAIILLFLSKLRKNTKYSKSDLGWIVPLFLLSLSFAIYENPFFKTFTLFVFPIVLSLFYVYAWVDKKKEIDWDWFFISKIVGYIFSFLEFIGTSTQSLVKAVYDKEKTKKGIIKRVLVGLIILAFLLLFIVPLLSSADPVFALKLKPIYDTVINFLSSSIITRTMFFIILSIGTLAALIAWGRVHKIEAIKKEVSMDIVISSIVLLGIFLVYLLFLWIQVNRLWVGTLPFDFKETENLVKSGFWQLLFLSVVNLAIFFFLYRKTVPLGQKLLGLFSIASILLLVSSAHRMALYVIYYGFSYEKFYASYTVLFCAILFMWLVSRLFVTKKSNIVKLLAFQFLWMFALISIFPVELFILKSNMALVNKTDSKILLIEMKMLSQDVLPQVKKYKEEGKLNNDEWNTWMAEQEKKIQDKKWYEFTFNTIKAKSN